MSIRSTLLAIVTAVLLLALPPLARAQEATGGGSAFPAALYAKWIEMARAETGVAESDTSS